MCRDGDRKRERERGREGERERKRVGGGGGSRGNGRNEFFETYLRMKYAEIKVFTGGLDASNQALLGGLRCGPHLKLWRPT